MDTTELELGWRVAVALDAENTGTPEQRMAVIRERVRDAQRRERILAIIDATR